MDATGPRTLAILVGLQASGKSTFARTLAGYVHVSNDHSPHHPKPRERLARLVSAALASGRSVVVDNTSPTVEDRARLVALGRAAGARCVAYYLDTPVADCVARNAAREGRARVPVVALFATRKRLVLPSVEEGLDAVLRVRCAGAQVRLEPLTREAVPEPAGDAVEAAKAR